MTLSRSFRSARRAAAVVLAGALAAFAADAATPAKPLAARLSADDQADVTRIAEYLNNISTMQSRFLQVSSNGGTAEGQVYLSRPGKMRIEYAPPVPILIVIKDKLVGHYDRELKQVQYIGTDQTPAEVLLLEKVRLSGGPVTVTKFERGPGVLRLTLAKTDDPGLGRLTLVFSDRPLALRKWTVLDGQGITTEVSLMNPRFGAPVAATLFEFDEMETPRPGSAN